MAKDDYFVILYKLLVYLYACKKRQIIFEEITFQEAVRKNVKNDQYFYDILEMAQDEGLIKNVSFVNAWGGDKIILSAMNELEITANGIRYLKDNSSMKKISEMLKTAGDIISKLASLLEIF
ncbi:MULTISPECIES: YjcQ family protein [Terrabacteria group]|uniref:YjcQ family protein n=1 Tax=Bacillati TaxID=1783272 RepID=UPI001C6F00AA|nr:MULTISPECIES: YjcQ family protein [Terrabacteria group]MBW9212979.1 YjcQ family protein [Trueperella sp. zg.1013]